MFIQKTKAKEVEFEGLGLNSSMAKIVVPSGVRHRTAYSKRSDKFYFVMAGQVEFTVDGNSNLARQGDVCVIRKEQKFSYANEGETEAVLLFNN